MAVRRSANLLNQQRIDIPHLRSIESAVRSDFDELLTSLVLGEDKSYVLRGFDINMSGAIGASASSLQLIVAEGSIFHGKSTESGTFFSVPSGTPNEVLSSTTNEKVDGSFTPNALNYIGLEFTRQVDDNTTAQVFLWNPTTKNEISKTAPLALVFDYKIVITSSIFASNVLPLAIAETDASNNILSIEDRRPMLFRLGTAGSSTPNPFSLFPWSAGRSENFYKSTTSTSPFEGGDKQIKTLKDWMDAMMTSIQEIKGTTYWYSDGAAGSIFKLRADLDRTQITGAGKISHSSTVAGQLNWDSDIFLNFVGSRLSYKIASNASTADILLSDDQVAYVKLIRGVDISPKLIFTQSSAIVNSVGSVSWTSNVLAGDWIKIKTANDTLYYQILSVDSASQVTLTESYLESSTGTAGTEAQYAYGTYQTDPSPSTDRHIKIADRRLVPFEDDVYWLFLRKDNGGSTAKVYMRGVSGGEIEQGESRQISDNTTNEFLEYVGSPAESDSTPDYTNAIAIYLPEITRFTFPAGSSLSDGQSFKINSANNKRKYYVWANVDGGGSDPLIPGRLSIEVAVSSSANAVAVGAAFHAAINSIGDFNSVDNLDGTIDVTNSQVGATDDAVNIDMGTGFSVVVTQQGIGRANCALIDDENLTKGNKRLDEAICLIQEALDKDAYREKMDVVSGPPANDNEVTGPVSVGTILTLPLNSKNSNVQQQYEVDGCTLVVYLNGDRLLKDRDYLEVGTSGSLSTTIDIQRPLEVGDTLEWLLEEAGAGGSGSSTSVSGVNLGAASDADVFKQTVGTQLQFRRLTAGSGVSMIEGANDISISVVPQVAPKNVITVIADYVVQATDNVVLVNNSGTDITVTLPSATSAGREITIKKIGAANLMFIKSIGGQLLDNVDIDATPHSVNIQYESVTVIADGTSWWIL